ncbi:MAG TPA: hypothetical protein VGF87_08985 [Acidimicrobiales bacterium]|jgi:hypothetical protein
MVIGTPWEDPQHRPQYTLDLNAGSGDTPDDDDFPGSDLDEASDDDTPVAEVREGPGGIDDPETEWALDETADEPLPELDEDEIWLLVPGEELLIATGLPKPRHLPCGIAIRPGEIAVCSGRRRGWSRTPVGSSSEDAELPMAHTVRMVFIRHRASGVRTRPRKYLIVTDQQDEALGWLDYSDYWNFENGSLRRMVEAAGLRYEVERFNTEGEFESAHPEWVG